MKTVSLSALLFLLPLLAQAESLLLRCEGVELSSRDLENYQLKDEGRRFSLKSTYQDEQMVQVEKDGTVYQFVNLGGCIDSSPNRVKTLLVISERFEILRPFAAKTCDCQFR